MILLVLTFVSAGCASSTPPLDVTTGWEYRWGDSPVTGEGVPSWVDGTAFEWRAAPGSTISPPGDRQPHLWLRVRLPEGEWPAPAVYFSSVFEAAELYHSGRLLARVGDMEPSWRNRFNYLNWHIVLLPPNFAEEYLYFRVYSDDGPNIGLSRRVRVGTQDALVRAVVGHHGDTFVFGTLFIVIGVFALFLSLERRAANRSLYLSFGGFVLCTGIFFVCINSVSQLALSSLPLRYYLGYMAFLLLPVGLFAFYEQIIDLRYQAVFRWMWRFHALLAIAGLVLDLTGVALLVATRFVVIALLPIDLFILFFVGARVARLGNVEARLFNFGFGVLGAAGLHDLLLSFGILPDWHHLFGWGALVFVLTLGYILEHRFTENVTRLRAYSERLESTTEALRLSNVKLEDANVTLEERVRDRTLDLNGKNEELESALERLQETQQHLIIQEKMASLGNLVAGVAHEINTPVAALSSSAETSRLSVQKILEHLEAGGDDAVNESLRRAIDVLRKNQETTWDASQRMATIVRSLRHFARLDEATRQRADMHEGLETTLELLQHELGERIEVVKKYGKLPLIDCYANRMNQVFMNLLLNAARAIEERGTITISTAAEGDKISISIADTGVGIPPEHQQKVFDPGFTTKGVGVGTGLGLATSYRIVKDHGGDIEVASAPGRGTTFTIRVPVDAAAAGWDPKTPREATRAARG